MRRAWWVLWLVLGAQGCSGCTKAKEPWVDRLEVDAFQGGEVISLSEAALLAQLRAGLEANHFHVADDAHHPGGDVKPWRVKLAAGLSEPVPEALQSGLGVVLELRHTGEEEGFVIDERRVVKIAGDDSLDAIQAGIRDAFDQALGKELREAAALIRLEPLSAAALRGKLDDPDVAVRDAAVRLLVRLHDHAALPLLLPRLESEDLDVLRVVMGQLVELRDPASVNPLIEAASHKGPVFQREVVFAIGAIGGEDAEAYLDLVATGHDDPLIRASATQALSELRAHRDAAPRSSP